MTLRHNLYQGGKSFSPYINRFTQPDTIIPNPANPQSLNRFGYVLNNPIRFNDPTGHVCSDPDDPNGGCDGGGSAVNVQGLGSGSVVIAGDPLDDGLKQKKPKIKRGNGCGQRGIYSPECPGWHEYTTTNLVCPAEFQCTAEEMKDYLARFAYPGQDPSDPVIGWRYAAVTDPWFGILPKSIGAIITEIGPTGLTVTNTTRPGHILDDGKIVRTASQAGNGAWYLTTNGYGNNYTRFVEFDARRPDLAPVRIPISFASMNVWGGIPIFDEVDAQMLDYIVADQK